MSNNPVSAVVPRRSRLSATRLVFWCGPIPFPPFPCPDRFAACFLPTRPQIGSRPAGSRWIEETTEPVGQRNLGEGIGQSADGRRAPLDPADHAPRPGQVRRHRSSKRMRCAKLLAGLLSTACLTAVASWVQTGFR